MLHTPTMSVRIRLTRKGTNNKPFYRVVAACKTKPRDGRYLEVIGTFDPKAKDRPLKIKKDRYDYWVSQGAQPTKVILDWLKKVPAA